jgi:hypothetical protein
VIWIFQEMEDRLHELMTVELVICWGLGSLPRRSPVSSDEASHVAVGVVHTFLNYPPPCVFDDEDISLQDRMSCMESWRSSLKALSDQFS